MVGLQKLFISHRSKVMWLFFDFPMLNAHWKFFRRNINRENLFFSMRPQKAPSWAHPRISGHQPPKSVETSDLWTSRKTNYVSHKSYNSRMCRTTSGELIPIKLWRIWRSCEVSRWSRKMYKLFGVENRTFPQIHALVTRSLKVPLGVVNYLLAQRFCNNRMQQYYKIDVRLNTWNYDCDEQLTDHLCRCNVVIGRC